MALYSYSSASLTSHSSPTGAFTLVHLTAVRIELRHSMCQPFGYILELNTSFGPSRPDSKRVHPTSDTTSRSSSDALYFLQLCQPAYHIRSWMSSDRCLFVASI